MPFFIGKLNCLEISLSINLNAAVFCITEAARAITSELVKLKWKRPMRN